MARRLRMFGELMFRFKWLVVIGWVVILGILAVVMFQVGPKTTSEISIPGTQAQVTLDRFKELFPDTGAASAKVVVAAPEGKTIADYQPQIDALTAKIAEVSEVSGAYSPFLVDTAISKDGTIGFITVQLNPVQKQVSEETISDVRALIADAETDGLTIVAGGDLVTQVPGEILGVGEILGLVVALLVLVITLGSLIAAGMPLVTAIVAVGVSMTGLFALSNVVELTSTAPVLAVMLGLAVGIDYSLFIVNRYRTYVKEGYGLKEASGRAIATAGNAVVFAASTVVIALVSLSVVQIPFMTVMGVAAAGTVAIAALVAITLIPAMFGIFGMHIFSRKTQKAIREQQKASAHEMKVSHSTLWYHWGEKLLKYRKTILASSLIIIVALAFPVLQLRTGLPTDEYAGEDTSQRQAYDLLVKGFGAGYNAPLLVVVEGLPETSDAAKAVAGPYADYYQLQQVANNIDEVDNVEQAQAVLVTDNGTKGVIQVTPTSGPSDQATIDLVSYLRDPANQKALTGSDDITIGVTGSTALQIDINKKLAEAMPIYLAVVVGLSLIILMLAFRSILIPIKATLGFLLSVFAMFGALVMTFQFGWFGITDAPGPIVSFIPIIAIGILFGLAMDYEFFLVSGMQEAYHHNKKQPKQAVLEGFALGSRVVVAAALIMIAVFSGFIGNGDATIQSMGFALAIGILVDAFIVRMTIVPIVMSYLGKSAWWLPKWLDKILPKVSIEGE